ncbi:MAG: rhodanese-like domain-containing protein [Bacteroidia bacterium]|nr:rhodanese-like domain-containing protein [Bacteroidia bacterium]
MKKLSSLLMLLLVGGFFLQGCSQSTPNGNSGTEASVKKAEVKQIQVDDFKAMVDAGQDFVLLDVRTPEEWAGGVAEGAQKINYQSSDFKEKIAQLDKSKEYVVVCAVGGRSGKACNIMSEMGFEKVNNVQGGMNGWISKGYPVVK